MKELNLYIKITEDSKRIVYIVDRHMNILEDQKKLKAQLMFEEPKLMSTIMETFNRRYELVSYAENYCKAWDKETQGDFDHIRLWDDMREKFKEVCPRDWVQMNPFPDVLREKLNKVLTNYEINRIGINWGMVSEFAPKGWITCTSVTVKIPRNPRPEYREMPSLDSLNYRMEDL